MFLLQVPIPGIHPRSPKALDQIPLLVAHPGPLHRRAPQIARPYHCQMWQFWYQILFYIVQMRSVSLKTSRNSLSVSLSA